MTHAFFDTHAHIDVSDFDGDREDMLARARSQGVIDIVVIGAQETALDAARAVALAQTDPHLHAAVGIHPHHAGPGSASELSEIGKLARRDEVVAIGETGLDYFYDNAPKTEQLELFRWFASLAGELEKPLICHIRDAHDDALEVLRSVAAVDVGCIIHCFTGTAEDARRYVELGCYISIAGIATFKNATALREAIAVVPDNRLLLETDCPYLAPAPVRGKRNEPSFLVHTAKVVADVRGVELSALANQTTANARGVFRIE